MDMEPKFQQIYPFTTEFISQYIGDLDVSNRSVLTVGSSIDQAYNAILEGASKVTIIDINKQVPAFRDYKTKCLMECSDMNFFYRSIIDSKEFEYSGDIFPFGYLTMMNNYMKDRQTYQLLQQQLLWQEIGFINGDVFDISKYLKKDKFDVMILSNVLQYYHPKSKDKAGIRKELLKLVKSYIKHLNDGGSIMLDYIYLKEHASIGSINLNEFIGALAQEEIMLKTIPVDDDGVALLYKKDK